MYDVWTEPWILMEYNGDTGSSSLKELSLWWELQLAMNTQSMASLIVHSSFFYYSPCLHAFSCFFEDLTVFIHEISLTDAILYFLNYQF